MYIIIREKRKPKMFAGFMKFQKKNSRQNVALKLVESGMTVRVEAENERKSNLITGEDEPFHKPN